ncbi:MAG TPA: hypothetical protein DD438_09040 [Verrucomicrobiales bacterium]|nr:hypothetical protein [Verrucomicrobiales bacterium]
MTEFSLSETKKVTVQNCEECGRRMLIPWVHKQMLHYMTWGLCGLAVVLAAGALVDGRKGNLVAVYAAICTILLGLPVIYLWLWFRNPYRSWKKWAGRQHGWRGETPGHRSLGRYISDWWKSLKKTHQEHMKTMDELRATMEQRRKEEKKVAPPPDSQAPEKEARK